MSKLGSSIYTPYPDQQVSIAALLDKVEEMKRWENRDKRALFIGATGCGKTVIASEVKRGLYPAKMLFAVHRDELIEQTWDTLEKAGFPMNEVGVIAGCYKENRSATIQIITIQTGAQRDIDWFDWEYLFFDEGHATAFSAWGKAIAKQNPHKMKIHMTATPWREKKTECYEQLVPREHWVFAPLPGELIEMGRLVKYRYFTAAQIDTTDVLVVGGDFNKKELAIAANDRRVTEAGLRFWQKYFPGEKTIVFCVDVKHANSVAELAKKYGRKVAVVTSRTKIGKRINPEKGTRKYIYQQVRDGVFDMLISVDCLSEGFDVPSIRCVWGLRPTKSRNKFYQQKGRGMRTDKGKVDAIYLDQANNLIYEGDDGKPKGRFKLVEDLTTEDFYDEEDLNKGKAPPPRTCVERNPYTWERIEDSTKGCGAIVGAKALVCPECGYVLPVRKGGKAIAAGNIIEIGDTTAKKKREKAVKRSPEEEAAFLKEFQNFFIKKMDELYEGGWQSPGAAFMTCRNEFKKNVPRDYYPRWVKNRQLRKNDISVATVWRWIKAVVERQGDSGQPMEYWMVKFFPDIDVSIINSEYPPGEVEPPPAIEYSLSKEVGKKEQYVLFG